MWWCSACQDWCMQVIWCGRHIGIFDIHSRSLEVYRINWDLIHTWGDLIAWISFHTRDRQSSSRPCVCVCVEPVHRTGQTFYHIQANCREMVVLLKQWSTWGPVINVLRYLIKKDSVGRYTYQLRTDFLPSFVEKVLRMKCANNLRDANQQTLIHWAQVEHPACSIVKRNANHKYALVLCSVDSRATTLLNRAVGGWIVFVEMRAEWLLNALLESIGEWFFIMTTIGVLVKYIHVHICIIYCDCSYIRVIHHSIYNVNILFKTTLFIFRTKGPRYKYAQVFRNNVWEYLAMSSDKLSQKTDLKSPAWSN